MSEVITELKQPISYADKDGDMKKATFITLLPPTLKQIDKITPLKQAFVGAINDISERKPPTDKTDEIDSNRLDIIVGNSDKYPDIDVDAANLLPFGELLEMAKNCASSDDDKITGPQVMALLYGSSCNMTKVLLQAQELFKSGAALVDGEVKMTTPLMEKMSVGDFERTVGDYLANFIAPSLMDGL